MRVLFYKQVCCTHTCVNTVRTLLLNKLSFVDLRTLLTFSHDEKVVIG